MARDIDLGVIRVYKWPSSENLDSDALFSFRCSEVHDTQLLNSRDLRAAFSTLSETTCFFIKIYFVTPSLRS